MLRINLPTKLCRFRQVFVVSDKRLSFPTSVCCFWQALVVSDKALSFSDKRFVGKSRATKLYNSHDGIPHSCPGVNAAKWPEIRFTGTHIRGRSTWKVRQNECNRDCSKNVPYARSNSMLFVCSETPSDIGKSGQNVSLVYVRMLTVPGTWSPYVYAC